jgi:hypothetical protein
MDRRRSDCFVRLSAAQFHGNARESDALGAPAATAVKPSPDRAILDRLRETQDLVSGSKD